MADDDRIHEMEQQFNELRRAIAGDIADPFEASERRLREGLSKDLDARFEASEQRLRESLSKDVARQLETAQPLWLWILYAKEQLVVSPRQLGQF